MTPPRAPARPRVVVGGAVPRAGKSVLVKQGGHSGATAKKPLPRRPTFKRPGPKKPAVKPTPAPGLVKPQPATKKGARGKLVAKRPATKTSVLVKSANPGVKKKPTARRPALKMPPPKKKPVVQHPAVQKAAAKKALAKNAPARKVAAKKAAGRAVKPRPGKSVLVKQGVARPPAAARRRAPVRGGAIRPPAHPLSPRPDHVTLEKPRPKKPRTRLGALERWRRK